MDTLGKRIRTIRESLGLSQIQLAREIGGGAAKISKYEKDQREPEIITLIQIAKLGNRSLDWLLTGKESISDEKKDKKLEGLITQVKNIYQENDSKKLSFLRYFLNLLEPLKHPSKGIRK